MTIKDIAKESGYAVGTVSRVLNNHPDVSEKARETILAVVEKRMGIGIYGPALNEKGNSIGGIKILEYLSKKMDFNLF